MNQSFKQILEQYLDPKEEFPTPFCYSEPPVGLEFHALKLNLAFKTKTNNQYKWNLNPPPFKRILSPLQILSLNKINELVDFTFQIDSSFNLKQLKKAYRKAAFNAHPDRGGTTSCFLDLQKDYKILLDSLDL